MEHLSQEDKPLGVGEEGQMMKHEGDRGESIPIEEAFLNLFVSVILLGLGK
jgi:hypothetical protein